MANLEPDVVINSNTDDDVKSTVANELINNGTTMLLAQLSNADYTGHSASFTTNNPNNIDAIETVYSQIGNSISLYSNRAWVLYGIFTNINTGYTYSQQLL